MNNLTHVAIRNLKPGKARREIAEGNSLYVIVHETGRKSYAVRYRFGRRPRELTLPGGITLKAARALASAALLKVEQGWIGEERRAAKEKPQAPRLNLFKPFAKNTLKREGDKMRTPRRTRSYVAASGYPEIGVQPVSTSHAPSDHAPT